MVEQKEKRKREGGGESGEGGGGNGGGGSKKTKVGAALSVFGKQKKATRSRMSTMNR